jgi:hypothetical protein
MRRRGKAIRAGSNDCDLVGEVVFHLNCFLVDFRRVWRMTLRGCLKQLEDAGLVVTKKRGREKLHFLNPVPIRLIHDRWIDKYTERQVSALADLKNTMEEAQ